MNPKPSSGKTSPAFTLLEVLVVVAFVLILIVALLPQPGESRRQLTNACLSNLRQHALAYTLWSSSNSNQFPWEVSTKLGGSLELRETGTTADHFQAITNFLPTPVLWRCLADRERLTAPPYGPLTSTNLSYFISLDATVRHPNLSRLMLTGDRHLTYNGQPVTSGVLVITNFAALGWQKGFHGPDSDPRGVIAFVDGHVEIIKSSRLPAVFQAQGLATNRLVIP